MSMSEWIVSQAVACLDSHDITAFAFAPHFSAANRM